MTIRPDLLLAHDFGELRQSYEPRDAILYALGAGLGGDPRDIAYLDETRLEVLPPFAATRASPGMWIRDPRFGAAFDQLVHLRQDARFHASLPPAADIVGSARVVSITDRGAGRGAELVLERTVRDAASGARYATIAQTLLLRGDGGFGGVAPDRPPSPVPDRAADVGVEVAVSPRAALIYRLSGDWNPLHIDPGFAARAGFDRPILHGLCTYVTAGIAVARAVGAEPGAIGRLAARFSGIVYPGDVLRLHIWRGGDRIAFTAHVADRKVLDDGLLELRT